MIRRIFILALKLAITVAAIVFLLSSEKLQLSQLSIKSEGWYWIPVAALLVFLQMILIQIRYWLLLRVGGAQVNVGRVIRIGLISWFLNASLLGGFGFLSGDAVRIGYLMRESDRYSAIVGAALLDRIIGLTGLLTLAAASLTIGYRTIAYDYDLGMISIAIYAPLVLAGVALVLLVILRLSGRLRPNNIVVLKIAERSPRIADSIIGALSYVTAIRNASKVLFAAYAYAVVGQCLAVLAIFLLAHSIAVPLTPSVLQVTFAAPIAFLTAILPLPANGLGVAEIAFDAMLKLTQGSGAVVPTGGATIFLSYRILSTIAALVGLPFFLVTKRDPRQATNQKMPTRGFHSDPD